MTTADGIGSPRRREVVERDRTVLEMIKARHSIGKCTRLSDVREVLPPDLSRSQSFYVLKRLQAAGASVTVYPHVCDPDDLASHDGVLLSNGPGDPAPLVEETRVVRETLGRVPMLGICLGHQLMGLATGHETTKLPFGHRGANHPVLDRRTGRVLVTSQNHGFAVVPTEGSEETHVSLYDGTVEGFDFAELRAASVQFHPEAGPGPHDAWPILERWVGEVRDAA